MNRQIIDNLNERSTRQWIYMALIVVVSSLLIAFIVYRFRKVIRHQITRHQRTLQSYQKLQQKYIAQVEEIQSRDRIIAELQNDNAELSRIQQYNIEHSDIYLKINSGEMNIHNATQSDLETAIEILNVYSNNFASRLLKSHPDMTGDDLWLCILIRMRLTNNQTAGFFVRDVETIRSRRKKIRKVFFADINPDLHINDIIDNY